MIRFPKRITVFAFLLLLGLSAGLYAQDPVVDVESDPEMKKIEEKYAEQYQRLEQDGKEIEKQTPTSGEEIGGVKFDFSKMTEYKFLVPEFRMRTRSLNFNVPQMTMNVRKVVWSVPETRMKDFVIGHRPVIKCWPCRTKMAPIIVSKPVVEMVRKEASFNIPEVSMKETSVKVGIPEVFRNRTISFKLPEIKVQSTDQKEEELKKAGADIEKAATALSAAQQAEINDLVKTRLRRQRSELEDQYKLLTKEFTDAIDQVKKVGGDPNAIVGEDGSTSSLPGQLDEASKAFTLAFQRIDEALLELERPN